MPLMPLMLALVFVCLLPAAEVVNANVASPAVAPEFREAGLFTARITVQNLHQRAVRIDKLDTTCACSKLELASRFLAPGETTTLEVASDNLRRSGAQQVRVSLFLTDPDLEPIEVMCWWNVREAVSVDVVPPGDTGQERPADTAWRDVYRLVAHERPDEPQRLRKRIRLATPDPPAGGLRVEGIDYTGTLWAFTTRTLENGAIVVTASSRDETAMKPGEYQETAIIRTNHPDKPRIELHLDAQIDTKAGRESLDLMQRQ